MKQPATNENEHEILKNLRYLKNQLGYSQQFVTLSSPKDVNMVLQEHNTERQLPRQEVINNILGYAKAMQVFHKRDGKTMFLVNN
ncbi:MAG: hypothetical protein EA394_07520 [Bacteroidia bacterium]|nr:MAG: hypothetical protein EA394_07520 [Bacteroidia bacterium]